MTEFTRIIVDAIPSDLDPDRLPIIAQHFFGWRRLGDVAAAFVADVAIRRKHKVLQKHAEIIPEPGPGPEPIHPEVA